MKTKLPVNQIELLGILASLRLDYRYAALIEYVVNSARIRELIHNSRQ